MPSARSVTRTCAGQGPAGDARDRAVSKQCPRRLAHAGRPRRQTRPCLSSLPDLEGKIGFAKRSVSAHRTAVSIPSNARMRCARLGTSTASAARANKAIRRSNGFLSTRVPHCTETAVVPGSNRDDHEANERAPRHLCHGRGLAAYLMGVLREAGFECEILQNTLH